MFIRANNKLVAARHFMHQHFRVTQCKVTRIFFISLIRGLMLGLISFPAWAEVTTTLAAGVEYTTGKYGSDTSTNILYIPVTGKFQFNDIFFKLTVPYISVTSSGIPAIRGMGKLDIKNTATTKTVTQSGLGDAIASLGYNLFRGNNLMLDLVGNIKFGTADVNKNLGTGENDYSAQIDGLYNFESTSIFATAGYMVMGEPANVQLNNIFYGTLGFSLLTGTSSSVGFMLEAAQSSSELTPGTREATLFFAKKISSTMKVQTNLIKGLSDSSPDYGASVTLTGMY
jgi:hypothetical protein